MKRYAEVQHKWRVIMKSSQRDRLFAPAAVAVALALTAPLTLAQGKPPGAGGGGGGNPHGEESVNNLAFPAVEINAAGPVVSAFFNAASAPVLGQDFSYGCNVADTSGERTYPNTSCVSADGKTYYTPSQCQTAVANCSGQAIERIYWQKTTTNDWSSDTSASGLGQNATHLD